MPRVPPICRVKVADAVATPIIRGETAFCTANVSGCMFRPRPAPKKVMIVNVNGRGVSGPTKDIQNIATARIAEPMMGKTR